MSRELTDAEVKVLTELSYKKSIKKGNKMNKELTPLEVSKQLKDFVLEFVKNGLDRMFVNGSFDIIEAALKRLEKIENTNHSVLREDISKKLKAIEIIKKHTNKEGVYIDFNKVMKATVKNFNSTTMTYIVDEELIKEYDLLKEVLL